jgi:TolB-like protein
MTGIPEDRRQSIQAQLDRILASATFAGSDRHRRFLRFVVEQALKGDTDRLNEFVLGFEVFNKSESFDPRIDSIVRVEARRLRERLKKYYQEEGREDPIVITLRPRSFAPSFEDAVPAAAGGLARPPWREWVPSHKTIVVALGALLCGVIATVLLLPSRGGRPLMPPGASIIVLPFQNLTPSPDQDSLGDAMADALITGLAGTPGLRVISRGSGIQFKESGRSPYQFAAELNVDLVVEGTVSVKGAHALVSAKVTDTRTQSYVWAQTQERETAALPELGHEMAIAIASRISTPPPPDSGTRPATRRAANWEAYDAYLKGQYYWYQWDSGGVEKSIAYFEQAVRGDPNYAPAWAWLSQGYHILIVRDDGQNPMVIAKGRQAAMKSLELDPQLAEAHAAVASYAALDWDWTGAERGFRRAIELNPNWAHAHLAYAVLCLLPTGRMHEAMGELFRARELDPLTKITRFSIADMFYNSRDYARAIAEYEDLRKSLPTPSPIDGKYFLSLSFSGQGKRAVAELSRTVPSSERSPAVAVLGYLQAKEGDRAVARKIQRGLIERSRREYVPPLEIAMVSAGLGDKDEAFHELRQAVTKHVPMVCQVAFDPVFDPLRSDKRYVEILRDIGLRSKD